MLLFNESIKSSYTRQNYFRHLQKFLTYTNATTYGELLEMPIPTLQILLENYLIELKKSINPNSVPTMFLGIRHFFIMNGISLNWEIIRKMYPQKTKPIELKSWNKQDIKKIINVMKNRRDIALVYFLASTGARIGVFDHKLQIKHIKKMPSKCLAINLYSNSLEEYWSFLTPQATLCLLDYLNERKTNGEIFTEETFVFRNLYQKYDVNNVKKLNWSGVRSIIYRAILKSGIRRTKYGFRYDIQADHGFRKFFNTTLKLNMDVNYNIAEKLMGHKNGLDGTYLTPTIEQCFLEFQKAIPDLKI